MQDGGDADAGAEMPGVGGNGQHRLRCGAEQQVVDRGLVLQGHRGNLRRQREHDVEVAHGQQVGLALFQPGPRGGALALRAMPVAARVIGDPPMAAVHAGFDVAAERGGPAVLDGRHDLELGQAQMPGMGSPVAGPGAAEDIGDLERGAQRLSRQAQPVAERRSRACRAG